MTGLTAWQRAEVDRLAELRLLAERLRAKAINGQLLQRKAA
jgi:hypothetical protein